jgi:hypothetical protein
MEDIYGKIRDKMNNASEVKATDQDWENFLNHRQSKDGDNSNKVIWPYWAVASLLFLLGATNIYWLTMDSNTNRIIATNIESVDTVYITKYIENPNINSIIAQERAQLVDLTNDLASITSQYQNLRNRLNNQSAKITQLQSYNDRLESKYALFQNQRNDQTTSSLQHDPTQSNSSQDTPVFDSKLEERIFLHIIGQLPMIKHQNIAHHTNAVVHPSQIIVIKNEKPFDLVNAITPKTLSMNANAAFAFNPSIDNYTGLAMDIRVATLFSKNLRGYTGFSFLSSSARINENHISNPNVPYPIIQEGDNIEHSDEKLSQLSINGGLEYLLNPKGKWRPYAGLGFGRVLRNAASYNFEIETATGNEYYIATEEEFTLGNYNQMIFTLGTDFNISSQIDMRLGLNYTYALQDAYNSSFFLKAGAYYHF